MKNIPLAEAFALIENASAVIVDGNAVTYTNVDDLLGESDNQFLSVGWEDEDREYGTKFTEGDNQLVTVEGTAMYLIDFEGDAVRLHLLQPMTFE